MTVFKCCFLSASHDSIVGTFRQAQKYQEKKDMDGYTAVVVLDEVGLAEDSPRMPLKALHPLLEDGCIEDNPAPHKKVSFIGISNWALDPAKMNRGILLSRGTPSEDDLIKIGRGIGNPKAAEIIHTFVPDLAKGYLAVYGRQEREYFGLRDFYGLIKMISVDAVRKGSLKFSDIEKCVRRNFGGFFGSFHPADVFLSQLSTLQRTSSDREVTQKIVLEKCISDIGEKKAEESRYLLLLTKNKAALQIIQMNHMRKLLKADPVVLFGSSFPGDQEYRQICTNINKIKICMETGKLVILCNLDNLHESLYDALNQNYVNMGGNRYVDLGLGTHRVKCRVHEDFKLIMVAEDRDVFENFPIPLINRLEKHYLGMDTILEDKYRDAMDDLEIWMSSFTEINLAKFKLQKIKPYEPSDVFIGYHGDVIPGLIMKFQEEGVGEDDLKDIVKKKMLENATPDSIVRLSETSLREEADSIFETYFLDQMHDSLSNYILNLKSRQNFVQITTRAKLFTNHTVELFVKNVGLLDESIMLLSLHQFKTENEFRHKVSEFCTNLSKTNRNILIVQLEALGNSDNLIECAKFALIEEVGTYLNTPASFDILFIVQLSSGGCFTGFPSDPWRSVHIDELHGAGAQYHLKIKRMKEMKISDIVRVELEEEAGLLDLDALMESSISPAASRVLDDDVDQNRMMKRIDIFRDAYKIRAFKQVSWQKILDLLVKREENSPEPEKWLTKMATYNQHIREGATFQTAVWKHLQDVLCPCLSLILSLIDPHRNLDHMLSTDWHKNMFLEMYRQCDITQNYQVDAKEFSVETFSTVNFTCQIPFVWNITRDEDQCSKIISSDHRPMTDAKAVVSNYENKSLFLDEYLMDFILQKLPTAKVSTLMIILKRSLEDEELQHVDTSIAKIHHAYDLHYQELSAFNTLVAKHPAILEELDDSDIPQRVDVFALRAYLDTRFVPKFDASENQGLEDWSFAFYEVYPIVDQILGKLDAEDADQVDIKKKWDQIHIFHVFLRHIFSKDLGEKLLKAIVSNLKFLWHALKSPDFETEKTFKKLVNSLTKMNKDGAKGLNLGGIMCVKCEESPIDPVLLQCEHVGCEKCLQEYIETCVEQNKEKRCPNPKCKNPKIEDDFKVESTRVLKQSKEAHDVFRAELSMFFIDCLDLFYFKDDAKPSREIVNTLLELVIIKKEISAKEEKTKDISPFPEHAIDPIPVVRSFILKLCLKSDSKLSKEFIQKILDTNSGILSDEDVIELCRLYIFTVEDMISQREFSKAEDGDILRMRRAVAVFEEAIDINDVSLEQFLTVDFLDFVSEQRFGHQTLARALLATLSRNTDPFLLNEANALIATAVAWHSEGTNLLPFKKYLIKEIHNERADSVGALKQNRALQNLFPPELWNTPEIVEKDLYLLYSDKYKDVRNQLIAALTSKDLVHLQQYLENNADETLSIPLVLGLQYLSEVKFGEKLEESLLRELKELTINFSDNERIRNILDKLLHPQNFPVKRRNRRTIEIKKMSVLALVSLMNVDNGIQLVFRDLIFTPESLVDRFVPTVEHDVQFETVSKLDGRLMVCPNNHVYSILDCGRPNAESVCPDCKKAIGGLRYDVEHQGNRSYEKPTFDPSRKGLKLPDTQPGREGVREMNSLEVNVTRAVMNICLLAGCIIGKARVGNLLGLQDLDQLLANLTESTDDLVTIISRKLGRSEDDALLLLHTIVLKLPTMGTMSYSLNSLPIRVRWEEHFKVQIR